MANDREYKSVALLDADILLYIASRGAEDKIDWGDGDEAMVIADLDKGKAILTDTVNAWWQMTGMDLYHICFSDRVNACFRNEVYPIYKLHRAGYKRPELYDPLSDWLMRREREDNPHRPYGLYDFLEADDALGLLQTMWNQLGIDTCIVSIDKDMLTIPGKHLNPNHEDPAIRQVDLEEADYNWMTQTISGDRVDNYKGAPGIGAARAAKILDPCYGNLEAMWQGVLQGYDDQWLKPNWRTKFQFDDPYVEALANARCARILREGDYNYETGKVNLWTP